MALVLAAAVVSGCGTPYLKKVERIQQPPPGKALVNFHRPSYFGGAEKFAIFDGNGNMLIDLGGKQEFQYVCDPGEQVFLGWADQASVVKADVAADKTYDIMIDIAMGWVRGNIRLVPLDKADPRRARLAEFEKRERAIMSLVRTPHVTDYEARQKPRIEQIKADFLSGAKSDRVRTLSKDDCR